MGRKFLSWKNSQMKNDGILKQLFVEKHSSYATAHYPTVKATLLYLAGWKLTASSDIM